MKRFLMSLMLTAVLTSCSKDKKEETPTTDPLIGEWVVETIVWDGKVATPDDCNKQQRVIITDKHFTYYDNSVKEGECHSSVHEYDYEKATTDTGQTVLKNVSNTYQRTYLYSLEENNTKLRITPQVRPADYTILKRK